MAIIKLYTNGKYWVQEDKDDLPGIYTVCDQDGCSKELFHVGDSYRCLDKAKEVADYWASGGHWMNRPDSKEDWV